MSGFIGIINLDGKPVERDLLVRMTDNIFQFQADKKDIWIDSNAGLGHAWFDTQSIRPEVDQPFSIDGNTYIVADARIDARDELISKLLSKESFC